MSPIAALSRAKTYREPSAVLWDRDPALLPALRAVVVSVAEAGMGARLVMGAPKEELQSLVSVHCGHQPWRSVGMAVLDSDEPLCQSDVVAVPLHGVRGFRGALILYCDPSVPWIEAEHIVLLRAHAAHIETLLDATRVRLATTQCTVDAFLQMLAAHDPATARHAQVVRRLARALGVALELPPHALLELEHAALLHDIGKVAVPLALLQQDGPLSLHDWGLMRQHPSAGERIVRNIPDLVSIAPAIRHHHERWDGTGYPDRLSGTAIPLHARLIGLADAYEAMRTGRPYQMPRSCEDVLHELRGSAGTQFDPDHLSLLHALSSYDLSL